MIAEIYHWKIGWLKDGVFTEDEYRENGRVYGNAMQLKFTCINCKNTVQLTTDYAPVPEHFHSLMSAYQLQPKCECGAIYQLEETAIEYELKEIGVCVNKNQTVLVF